MRHGRSRSQDDALGTAAAEGTCMEKGFDGTSLTSAEGEGKEVEMRARSSTLVRVRLVLDDGGKMI
jgi:hypothetical protein